MTRFEVKRKHRDVTSADLKQQVCQKTSDGFKFSSLEFDSSHFHLVNGEITTRFVCVWIQKMETTRPETCRHCKNWSYLSVCKHKCRSGRVVCIRIALNLCVKRRKHVFNIDLETGEKPLQTDSLTAAGLDVVCRYFWGLTVDAGTEIHPTRCRDGYGITLDGFTGCWKFVQVSRDQKTKKESSQNRQEKFSASHTLSTETWHTAESPGGCGSDQVQQTGPDLSLIPRPCEYFRLEEGGGLSLFMVFNL